MTTVAFQVREIVARHVDPMVVKPGVSIDGDITLREGLKIERLDIIEVAMAAEEKFDITIFDPEIDSARTVDDLISLVTRKLAEKERAL